MFDFEPGKLLIIGTVALLVIPAKDLPRVFRQAGQALGKLRRMATEFQGQFMEAMRQADQPDIAKDMTNLAESTRAQLNFDPLRNIRNSVETALSDKPATPVETHTSYQSDLYAHEPGPYAPESIHTPHDLPQASSQERDDAAMASEGETPFSPAAIDPARNEERRERARKARAARQASSRAGRV